MSQWISAEERRQLLLAQCVLRDVPFAMTKTLAAALVRAGIELPPDVRSRFPDLGDNNEKEAPR